MASCNRQCPYTRWPGWPFDDRIHHHYDDAPSQDHSEVDTGEGKGKGKGIRTDIDQLQLFLMQYASLAEAKGTGKGDSLPRDFGMLELDWTTVGPDGTEVAFHTDSCDHHISWDILGNMVIEPPFPCPRCAPAYQRQEQHATVNDAGPALRPGYADWNLNSVQDSHHLAARARASASATEEAADSAG